MSTPAAASNDYLSYSVEDTQLSLVLLKPITVYTAGAYDEAAQSLSQMEGLTLLVADFSKVREYDSYLAVLVDLIDAACGKRGIQVEYIGMSESMERFLASLKAADQARNDAAADVSAWRSSLEHIGEFTLRLGRDTRDFVEFFGELVYKLLLLLPRPGLIRWKDFPFVFTRAGVDAVPIVVLIGFLIGLIIGYQGAVQLKQFGADIYLADMIGVSITRELGPLMTAIIVAGRSGAAFAAEIGTMKVSEEIDALKSLGFDIMRFLVMPRVLAVMLAVPFLTLFADVAGILGGLLTGLMTLDLTLTGFFNQLQQALTYSHVFSGVLKSVVFGFLIATMGCFRGLQVFGGAESVGKYTTAAVVSGIFLIIFVDAIFAFVFQVLDI